MSAEPVGTVTDRCPLVIYHAGCRDGFAAAWAARKALPGAELFPAAYGTEPPYDLAKGREVIVADFCYSREQMLALAERCTLSVYDHHKTAQAALDGFAEELDQLGVLHGPIVFDMERSGAGIVWDELMPGANFACVECHGHLHGHKSHDPGCLARAPWLIRYVEDRDLWRFALPDSREVNACIATLPYGLPENLSVWDEASETVSLQDAVSAGRIALRAQDNYVTAVCANALWRFVPGSGLPTVNTWKVPSVNAPQHEISEVLERLLALNPQAPFVHGWWQRADGIYTHSLRSRGDFDVSAVAKRMGGGGHKAAAGYQTTEAP